VGDREAVVRDVDAGAHGIPRRRERDERDRLAGDPQLAERCTVRADEEAADDRVPVAGAAALARERLGRALTVIRE